MSDLLLAVPLGVLIGLVVGAVGGGGAILALPVLVYVLGEPPGPASTAALVVVAVAAAVGAGLPALQGRVCWPLAVAFSAPAALASLAGALLNAQADPRLLILAFIPVMLTAAVATWRRAAAASEHEPDGECPAIRADRILPAGLIVGGLTGFFGVGGGFVIVPLLSVWFGLSLRRAIATSLVIITLTGLAALASHLAAGPGIADLGVTAALAGATGAGALAGALVSARLPVALLGHGFAIVVTIVAALLLVDVAFLGGPPGGG